MHPTSTNRVGERERLDAFADLTSLPRAYGKPPVKGDIRAAPEDFVVTEVLPFTPAGEGEHLYLLVRKCGQNTRWVAQQLGRDLSLPTRDIGYAGLKDRHAITDQWFSLQLPGRPDPDSGSIRIPGVEILDAVRHTGKLRRGMLAGNRFRIRVRNVQGDRDELGARLARLRDGLVPNYFGPQRFGRQRANLELLSAAAALERRPRRESRSFGLSALRSALFNGFLDLRVRAQSWRTPLAGEILYCPALRRYRHRDRCQLAGIDDGIPSGLLWGSGVNQATDDALHLETEFFAAFPGATGLIAPLAPRLTRRPLCMTLDTLAWDCSANELLLEFELRRGQFATVALREFVDITDLATA